MMKSYYEIAKSCKLLNYTEGKYREETWQDSEFIHLCSWTLSNNTHLPDTIYRKKLNAE